MKALKTVSKHGVDFDFEEKLEEFSRDYKDFLGNDNYITQEYILSNFGFHDFIEKTVPIFIYKELCQVKIVIDQDGNEKTAEKELNFKERKNKFVNFLRSTKYMRMVTKKYCDLAVETESRYITKGNMDFDIASKIARLNKLLPKIKKDIDDEGLKAKLKYFLNCFSRRKSLFFAWSI